VIFVLGQGVTCCLPPRVDEVEAVWRPWQSSLTPPTAQTDPPYVLALESFFPAVESSTSNLWPAETDDPPLERHGHGRGPVVHAELGKHV
jgi:hypothetical protein